MSNISNNTSNEKSQQQQHKQHHLAASIKNQINQKSREIKKIYVLRFMIYEWPHNICKQLGGEDSRETVL